MKVRREAPAASFPHTHRESITSTIGKLVIYGRFSQADADSVLAVSHQILQHNFPAYPDIGISQAVISGSPKTLYLVTYSWLRAYILRAL
jgi:hypothetical protein